MSARTGIIEQVTIDYLEKISDSLQTATADEISDRICGLVSDHEYWRSHECLNLNAAEALMSRRSRQLLASDLATRVSEGFPAQKEYPAPEQNIYIDEIEGILIHLAKRAFKCDFVEWRPTSTSMANATVFHAFCEPGDTILTQSPVGGGNYSYNIDGPPNLQGLKVVPLPQQGPYFEIDADATMALAQQHRPKLIVIGGSNVLFPYPVARLREIADSVDAKLVYDAAHLSTLIAYGGFQDPLREGAHLITTSTHKLMGGAVGGLIIMNDADIAQKIMALPFPAMMQTRDQNKLAATANALAEMGKFGPTYVKQVVANARALAIALEAQGFELFAAEREYTNTHQIFLNLDAFGAQKFENLCQRNNILVSRTQHSETSGAFSDPGGARLTVQEITRQGMTEKDMLRVARLISTATRDDRDIRSEVAEFVQEFIDVKYSFD